MVTEARGKIAKVGNPQSAVRSGIHIVSCPVHKYADTASVAGSQRESRSLVTIAARVVHEEAKRKVMPGSLRHVERGLIAVLAGKVSEHPQSKMGAASLHVPHPMIGIVSSQIQKKPHSIPIPHPLSIHPSSIGIIPTSVQEDTHSSPQGVTIIRPVTGGRPLAKRGVMLSSLFRRIANFLIIGVVAVIPSAIEEKAKASSKAESLRELKSGVVIAALPVEENPHPHRSRTLGKRVGGVNIVAACIFEESHPIAAKP
jgi:hypothetical protein